MASERRDPCPMARAPTIFRNIVLRAQLRYREPRTRVDGSLL
jgi:hypothetical protein